MCPAQKGQRTAEGEGRVGYKFSFSVSTLSSL